MTENYTFVKKCLMEEKGKTIAILSYCTLIGFIVAIVMHQEKENKSELGAYHLRQSLGIFLTGIAAALVNIIPILGQIAFFVAAIGLVVFWVLGLISAINGEIKPVPLLGEFYQNLFKDIK